MAELPFLYIRVPVDIDDHPKVMPLGNAAFRLLMKALGWCRKYETGGLIPIGVWRKWMSKRAREELLQQRLSEFTDTGDVDLTFYRELGQQSREEIDKARARAAEDGAFGAHVRHHARRGIVKDGCAWCAGPASPPDAESGSPPSSPPNDLAMDPVSPPVAEIEGEIEREVQADLPRHLQVVDASAREDDDHGHEIEEARAAAASRQIEWAITAAMAAATSGQVRLTPGEARAARTLLLAGRTDPGSPAYVPRPVPYVVSAVARDPARVLAEVRRPPMAEHIAGPPAPLPPAYSTSVAEAIARATRPAGDGAAQGG